MDGSGKGGPNKDSADKGLFSNLAGYAVANMMHPHGHGPGMGTMVAGGLAAAGGAYGMNGMNQMSHGAHRLSHGAFYGHHGHGKFKHGKFKHGKFGKLWKHGMFGKHKGGFVRRWK